MRQGFVSRIKATNDSDVARIWSLVDNLSKIIQLLDCDILAEEERVLVFDPQDIAYPMLARTLRTRRDNLKATIAMLKLQVGAIEAQSAA